MAVVYVQRLGQSLTLSDFVMDSGVGWNVNEYNTVVTEYIDTSYRVTEYIDTSYRNYCRIMIDGWGINKDIGPWSYFIYGAYHG